MTLPDLLGHQPFYLFFLFSIVVGLIVGSFLNVVIHRLPIMLEKQWHKESKITLFPDCEEEDSAPYNLAIPSSHCPQCHHKIRPWENIPIISYLLLKGRCSSCKTRISIRYPAIELITALLTLTICWKFGFSAEALAYCLFAWSLLALAMIDFDTKLLPDAITLPLIWAGLIVNSFDTAVSLHEALWGAVAGYLSLWSVYWLFKLVTGKEGMGYGDFKLLAALGAWLGWSMLPMIILLSSLAGTAIALILIALKLHQRSNPIPFGPYLALAGLIALMGGDQIIQTYVQMMGI
ncbi:A24 family peptidase [Endozoicomonas sp. Mp262]|uniref:prepilin peptidase n=1 Tax=Endozoicomonas sp. Mp262 TaxID=2919499 RepID=UPI0021DA8851